MRDVEDAIPDPDNLDLDEDLEPDDLAGSLTEDLIGADDADLSLDPELAAFASADELRFAADEDLFADDDFTTGG